MLFIGSQAILTIRTIGQMYAFPRNPLIFPTYGANSIRVKNGLSLWSVY